VSHGFRINIRREFAFERMNLLSRQIETPASFLGNFKLQDTTVYRMGRRVIAPAVCSLATIAFTVCGVSKAMRGFRQWHRTLMNAWPASGKPSMRPVWTRS
jgi:hypothetical protein